MFGAPMREIICFYWLCAVDAWRGSWSLANAWSGLWGPALLFGIIYWQGYKVIFPDDAILTAFLLALTFVVVTWIAIFAGRLAIAPARLWDQEKRAKLRAENEIAAKLGTSDIDLVIDNVLAFETITVDADGHKLPHAQLLCVRVSNVGNKFLRKCQITFGPKGCPYHVSGYFDLRRGEYKSVSVLRMNYKSKDHCPFLYFLRDTDWKIEAGGPGWWPNPGTYEIRALSADTHPATLGVELSQTNENWELRTIGEQSGPSQ
jgi:hypothetical protein